MILDGWQRECLEQQQLTATTLQREYQNGYLAGQKKAYDECDEVARELSQIKSGCSKWLDEHDNIVYNQALDDFAKKMNKMLEATDLRDNGYYIENLVSIAKNELKNRR